MYSKCKLKCRIKIKTIHPLELTTGTVGHTVHAVTPANTVVPKLRGIRMMPLSKTRKAAAPKIADPPDGVGLMMNQK